MSIFPTTILLATDGSKEAELAARTVAALADKTGSELHVVHVFGIIPWYPAYPEATDFDGTELEDPVLEEDLQRISEQRARELLDAEVEKIRSVGGTLAQAHLREGGAPHEIVGLAEEIGVGLVAVGSRGRGGIGRALMGSVSDSVVRHAHCPVTVVRGEPLAFPTKILLATDGSEDAQLAAKTAVDLSKKLDSELHVVYVGPMPEKHTTGGLMRFRVDLPAEVVESVEQEAKSKLEEQVQKIKQAGGEVAQAHSRAGLPEAEIVTLAEELGVGLIVRHPVHTRPTAQRIPTSSLSDRQPAEAETAIVFRGRPAMPKASHWTSSSGGWTQGGPPSTPRRSCGCSGRRSKRKSLETSASSCRSSASSITLSRCARNHRGCASQDRARSPVAERTVRPAEVGKLCHPEGTTLRGLPVELHAQSRALRWQQVALLPLGLHRDDVGQERPRTVGLLLDAEVGA
jgi:nucleotide-binding universal stress UspA family protein